MSKSEFDTKDEILTVATGLFARNGYNGTSVREIASAAGANIAAINYHFQSKEGLYLEVFNRNHQILERDILNIGEDPSLDTKEFCWKVVEYFNDNGTSLINSFRIAFFEKLSHHNDLLVCNATNEMEIGPPGREVILQKITNDVGDEIPITGRHWAMRMIFSTIFHMALVTNAPFMQDKREKFALFGPEEQRKSIYNLVDAVLEHLKHNSENWS